MKVLVLGATGGLGSRLIPALLAHNHTVVAFVRTPSKLPASILSHLSGTVAGNAKSASDIEKALLEHNCDALVNVAGLAAMAPWGKSDLKEIFPAVLEGTIKAGKERGAPLRAWFMAGLTTLNSLDERYLLCEYIPLYREHRENYQKLLKVPKTDLIWSLLCPGDMLPLGDPEYPSPKGSADNLLTSAKTPPAWTNQLWSVPLIGGYLNMMSQAGGYTSQLEDNADLIARDLESGVNSQWAFERVGTKEKTKAA